jgi:hypothetical protein
VHQGVPLRTCHLQKFGKPLRYNSPDCPVCQRSNDYLRQRSSTTATVNSVDCVHRSKSRRQKAHRTVNSDCPVHHRTVWWPTCQKLQRSEPNGLVTWLAHRTVSGGHATEALTNDHFGGWGYKYPNHHTSLHPSFQPSNLIQEL